MTTLSSSRSPPEAWDSMCLCVHIYVGSVVPRDSPSFFGMRHTGTVPRYSLDNKMASPSERRARPHGCQPMIIHLRTPDGRVHTVTGEARVEKLERRRKEEAAEMKARLAVKNLEVADNGCRWDSTCTLHS